MKSYRPLLTNASAKLNAQATTQVSLTASLPLDEMLPALAEHIESFSAEIGLTVIRSLLDDEIARRTGRWGQQRAWRHGEQNGYILYGGCKTPFTRPRLRTTEGKEVHLKTYRAFQQDGKRQRAVARQLVRHCSSRDYAGATDALLNGYGISKSSVSRQWKAATQTQLKELLARPVPADILAVFIDGKHFGGDCILVALGIDKTGKKHILGLWHGASENATAVQALLDDLIPRGLPSDRPLLFVIDGGKALRKAIAARWGRRAVVQRCRIHKMRNVIEHLPRPLQAQATWRLRAAWAQSDVAAAERELRAVIHWLTPKYPMAARSLEEGLNETLTLQRLGINEKLSRSLSSTNLIENCYSRVEAHTRRVTRWRDGAMILRWSAAMLLRAEQGFRRIRGYQHLGQLEQKLNQEAIDTQTKAA